MEVNNISDIFYSLDKRGVRAIVKYSTVGGNWVIECYRKKTKDESQGDGDWQMIREGHIQTYGTRPEAEIKVIKLAEEICEKYGY